MHQSGLRQGCSAAATWVTEQPYLGLHCSHPSMGRGYKMCLKHCLPHLLWPAHHSWWRSQIHSQTQRKNSKVVLLVLGTWNVWTLLNNNHADHPERRTALVAKEINRYGIQIAALSETHFTGEDHLTEHGSGFTIFWSGCGADECHVSGMGFSVRTPLIPKLSSLPKGINDHLMTSTPLIRQEAIDCHQCLCAYHDQP